MIVKQKGLYVLTVKANQKLLLEDITARIKHNAQKLVTISRDDRIIEILKLPQGYAADGFIGIKSYAKMTSSKKRGQTVIRYFISNLKDEELIAEAIEERWSIENDFHKEKDNFLFEDHFRSTNRNAAHNIVLLNNLILQLVKIYQAISGETLYLSKHYLHLKPIESIGLILSVMDSTQLIADLKKAMKTVKR